MTTTQDDYINPSTDGMLRWHYASSYTSNSEEGLENWQNRMHEVLGRHCAQLTKSLRWIGNEVCDVPMFVGLCKSQELLQEYEAQVPCAQRLKTLDMAL